MGRIGFLTSMVIEPYLQTSVDSVVLEPCVRPKPGAVCAPLSVWPQPSLCVVLMGTHMPVNVSFMSTPVHSRLICT